MSARWLAALAALAALVESTPALALDCPDEAAVKAAIETYITETYWSSGEREIWKVTDVGGFQFGPVKIGNVILKDVDYSGPREVCPARLEFSFTVEKADGSSEVTRMGKGQTYLFYPDAFDEWTFKIG